MPRIEVYTGNGSVIPTSIAKKRKAFQCPFTKKIFTSKRNYIEHLSKRRKSTIDIIKRNNSKKLLMNSLFMCDSFDDIIKWIEMHPTVFYYNAARYDTKTDYSEEFWIEILELDLEWGNCISNSHSCPHNGVTNWRRNEEFPDGSLKPRGYPGWRGTLSFRTSHDIGFASSLFSNTRIHTGSGSGSQLKKSTYEVSFFDADWPNIAFNTMSIRAENILLDTKDVLKYYYKKQDIKNGNKIRQ